MDHRHQVGANQANSGEGKGWHAKDVVLSKGVGFSFGGEKQICLILSGIDW